MIRRSLLLRDWPADWRARWIAATTPADDAFGDEGLAAHWAPDTQNVTRKRLEQFFGYLARSRLLDANLPLGTFLTEEVLRPWIKTGQRRCLSPVTVAGYVRDVRLGIRAMDPYVDDSVACLVARRLGRRARPTRDKSKSLVHPREIYRASLSRMDRVDAGNFEKEDVRAVQYGDGLAIAIVTASAIRLKNLVGICIGQELRRIGEGYRLNFAAKQMKSRRPFAADLPMTLTPYIERYIAWHRQQLLQGSKSERLFVSCFRGPMSRQTMHIRFKAATEAELGIAINPHRVRDLAVTYLAIEHPDQIAIATDLLNHARQRTSQEHYNQADQLSAGRDYNAVLSDVRREALLALSKGTLFELKPNDEGGDSCAR